MTHLRGSETVDSSPLVFVFIQTGTQTPSKCRRRLSQRREQLPFETEKITVYKRSTGWTDGQTSTQRAPTGVQAGFGEERPGDARLQHLSDAHSHPYARIWCLRVTLRVSDRQATSRTSECRNVGPFRDKRIISL